MVTDDFKSKIDNLWLEFWQGGIANPLTVIEQITYLMFLRLLDLEEERKESRAKRTNKPFKGYYEGRDDPRRWSRLRELGNPEATLEAVRDKAFKHLKEIGGQDTSFGRHMKDAIFMVPKASLLVTAMELINDLPLDQGDTKGDLYEYLLSKLQVSGINGQFRTPRHIIRLMVDLMAPKLTDRIADPACGTGGFLSVTLDYLKEHNDTTDWAQIAGDNFHGYDFDQTMLRIAAMNMMLHGIADPSIDYMDTLSNRFPEQKPDDSSDAFDLILANPPFKGSLDYEQVHHSLTRVVKTKKTELLFVVLMLRMLKLGGRCAVILPDGVLFGSSRAHKSLRKKLVDDNQLEAVISLPSGVFKPYAGVSTAILLFAKGGKTSDVFYYDVQADGFSLDDNRRPIDANDFPDIRKRWHAWSNDRDVNAFADRTSSGFIVPVAEIAENDYDLSISRYKKRMYEEIRYDEPSVIIGHLKFLEDEIARDLKELEAML